MPILPPALDDRSFEDLVADMLRRIPAHTPEWTDVREGDPGRALVELFAWMGDTILYRANLIPERQRLAFLRLLGMPLRPATPARGLVQVSIDDAHFTGIVPLPQHSPIAKPLPFETMGELAVLPVEGQCYLKRRPTAAETAQLAPLISDLADLYALGSAASPYVTTEAFAGGAAEMTARDIVAGSIDQCLWLALLAPDPAAATVAAVRDTLGGGAGRRRVALSVGISPFIDTPDRLEAIATRAPIPHVFELCTGDGSQYLPLETLADGTAGLTRTGVVRLLFPGGDDFSVPSNDMLADANAGVGERPPRIDDEVTAARLACWLRLRPLGAAKLASLQLRWAGVNAVMVEQLKTLGRQQIGEGTGLSGQQLSIGTTNVEAESLAIEVEEEEGMRAYAPVADIAIAAPLARAYSLDAEAGTIRFGDGVHGLAPASGRAIHVVRLRAGGGSAGNLPAGALKTIAGPAPTPKLKLNQPLPLTGGADSERLEAAEARIPGMLRNGERAVTKADYQTLAMATPGVDVARVEVLERFKPQQRRADVPGVVSVMVIPARAGFEKPCPRADRATLESVFQWLDQKRPLATELYVVAPDYVPIGVSAAVEVADPGTRDAVLAAVADAIRRHLWPLPPGGPDGGGWPLGRAIDDWLIETAIARVPGVRTVAPVRLFSRTNGGFRTITEDAAGRGRIELMPWQLPELAMLYVGEGSSAASTLPPDAAGTAASAGGVAIPVVPELC